MLKPKPWWLRWTASYSWITIAPNIYYPPDWNPFLYPGIIVHESVHAGRQAAVGLGKWFWRYFTSRGFRLAEEVAGMGAELKTYREPNLTTQLDTYAADLAGSRYWHAAPSVDEAQLLLRRAIDGQ